MHISELSSINANVLKGPKINQVNIGDRDINYAGNDKLYH